MHQMGHLCGYVQVLQGHSLYQKEEILDIIVHGGITFSGPLLGEQGWWIGFDCGHYGDYIPYIHNNSASGSYRNIQYTIKETKKLAKQLKDLDEQRKIKHGNTK